MATERKPVCFNIDDPLERELWEVAKGLNFSGWVKLQLRPLVQAKTDQRIKKGVGVPVPIRKVVSSDGNQA
ncbi:hypothetical protein EDM52_23995 [Brevibacillus invocatus]|uniref:Uncharacterized protein n=1 Tax=Brevibacillus invocatus TaxID=173959 RepID=A0A3M8BMF5_9BACL|nr:hypothetical protein [Brevibacillus invocatus]RNB64581.1 hypothetical protein EDM52_23995 [Brevibacillus invocatus]